MGFFDKITGRTPGKDTDQTETEENGRKTQTPVVEDGAFSEQNVSSEHSPKDHDPYFGASPAVEPIETIEHPELSVHSDTSADASTREAAPEKVPLLRQEADGTYIMERDSEILTWNADMLQYKKRSKIIDFALDGTVVIEFVCDDGLLGGRELNIWDKDKGLFGKNTQEHLSMCNIKYKKVVSIPYSKKELDIYQDIYKKLIHTLDSSIHPFCWTQRISPLLFDEAHHMIQDAQDHFYRFEDIKTVEIMEDGDTVVGGSVGQALIGGIILGQPAGSVSGTVVRKNTTSTVNSLDLRISLNGLEGSGYTYSFLRKPCCKTDKDYRLAVGTAQQLYASLLTILP